ncbi:MAG: hypothetical protein K940chlam2_00296 [Chlamydiae bacterium]|nr:hypothetical protein [Chlamydiota bacterium]
MPYLSFLVTQAQHMKLHHDQIQAKRTHDKLIMYTKSRFSICDKSIMHTLPRFHMHETPFVPNHLQYGM